MPYLLDSITSKISTLLSFIGILTLAFGCGEDENQPISERVTIDNISVPKGFEIQKIYEPGKNDQGSWVSITKDDKGRLYASDQYGNIYRVKLPSSFEDSVAVTKLDVHVGLAQGLLWHQGDLFALVNSNEKYDLNLTSGLYKITDSDSDGELDSVRQLRSFIGRGEHGPHNIELAPDGKSLFLVLGNHTDIPEDLNSTMPKNWAEDNLLPVILDPSGHANDVKAPGGWVVQTDFEGNEWNIISVGLRNTYDIAFNQDGELFGFDSDMEYDMGMPWYRPIRLVHLTKGADFGWRTGTGKFLEQYPDNLPGVASLGQGSPTGVMNGHDLKFPTYYQDGLYLHDWSYGTMYYAKLKPSGSTYTAEITEFLSGVPLPLTNGIAGNDGAMYFVTGGRRLVSGLYRLTYTGDRSIQQVALTENNEGRELRELRSALEQLQSNPSTDRVDYLLDHLDHSDRTIRFSARVALEKLDPTTWKDKLIAPTSLQTTQLAIALAHQGEDQDRLSSIKSLVTMDWKTQDDLIKIDILRGIGLSLARMTSEISAEVKNELIETYLPYYLSETSLINQELGMLLSYLEVSDIISPTLDKMESDTATTGFTHLYLSDSISKRSERYGKDVINMLRNMPNSQNISFAKSLSEIEDGWTADEKARYFRWFNNALNKSGGLMYAQFIRKIQSNALANVSDDDRQYYEALGEDLSGSENYMMNLTQPKGPGKAWDSKAVVAAFENNQSSVDFENGQNMFRASLCASCHSIGGLGGTSGPELTQVGTRFSIHDLAQSIVLPSETVSDRYRNTRYTLKDGRVMTGRLISETEDKITISTNAFAPSITTSFAKDQVVSEEESLTSIMPPALINRLNEQEVSDLIAYLLSGGNRDHELFDN